MKIRCIIVLFFITGSCFGIPATVSKIIDGDTFEIETGEKVRLIGINAPEITDIFGTESKTHLSQLILGKEVELLTDQISNKTDVYNRLLRYVYYNNIDINKRMIQDGYAFAYLKYNFERKIEYKEAQQNSSRNNLGIWGSTEVNKAEKVQDITNISKNEPFHFNLNYFYLIAIGILLLIGIYYFFKK
jgi:micrococcal nuclease